MLRELVELRDKVRSLQKDLDNERRDREHVQAHIAMLQAEIVATKQPAMIFIWDNMRNQFVRNICH